MISDQPDDAVRNWSRRSQSIAQRIDTRMEQGRAAKGSEMRLIIRRHQRSKCDGVGAACADSVAEKIGDDAFVMLCVGDHSGWRSIRLR